MGKAVLRYKTIILSDLHLGAGESKVEHLNHLLKHTHSEKLILNGDIVDGWSLLRRGGWRRQDTRFVRLVLKKMEKKGTEVVYVRGNHDDILRKIVPIRFDRLRIVEEHVHESAGRRYLVVHGDVFDVITTGFKRLAVLGDISYQLLLKVNRLYNRYRAWRGKEYFSLSKAIKSKVKRAVNHMGGMEKQLVELARMRDCQGIILGHIHQPDDRMIDGVHYLNSGDWVESCTALVEHEDGRFEILDYAEFRRRLAAAERFRVSHRPARRDERLLPVEEEVEFPDPPLPVVA
jgi:UDP-2,3-diacylglucosamine pyrophosphatase LpxH